MLDHLKQTILFITLFTPLFFLTSCGSTKNLGNGTYEESRIVWSEGTFENDRKKVWKNASDACSSQGKIVDLIQEGGFGSCCSWTVRFKCIDLATKQQRDIEKARAEEERQKQLKIQEEIDRKNRIEQEKENQRKFKAEEERKKRAEEEKRQRDLAEEQRKKELVAKCLRNGDIGMCLMNNYGDELYDPQKNFTSVNLYKRYLVQNNQTLTVKDIQFQCDQFGASGTKIKTDYHTVYQTWNPGQSKYVVLEFLWHSQASTFRCQTANWKPY